MSNQIVISSGAKVRSLEGVLTGTAGVVNSVPLGGANGVATLDSGGKVPVSQLPSSVVTYLGTWNAATNTPTLTNGTGDAGDMYLCNVQGTVNFGNGPITFAVGDWVLYGSGTWQKSNGQNGTVTSVAVTESGNALTITGSPITTAGTINIGFAGNSGQYINGEGNLVTFPTLITEAQNLITDVYNETGATLTKGTVVYINGGHGNLPTVTKAIATGDSTSAQTYGVVQADITNNNNGHVVVIGSLGDLDTQAYAAGTQLYLSSTTAGAWTSTKQYAPAHLVYVGIVVRSHPTQGVVEIKIQNGFELDELHNVSAQSPSNGNILQYNSTTSLWTAVAGTTTNIAEGTNLYYTDARSRAAFSETVTGLDYNSTTGVLSTSAGYGIPTTANQTNWTTAYNDSIVSAAVSGTTTKTLTLTQQDGGTVTASWSDYDTAPVTSVFGRTGAITAQSGDYTTTQVTEGTNLYFTNARARGAMSANVGSALTYDSANGRYTLLAADSGTSGYLTSTDWNTFNNKQASLGTGTTSQFLRGDLVWAAPPTPTLDDLTDVVITSPTNGQVLTYRFGDWKNETPASAPVTSVFGRTGVVVATSGDYNTDLVTEGTTNLYYTNTRARAALSANVGSALTYNSSTGRFTLNAADGTTEGYVTAADYNYWDAKQDSLGTGTTSQWLRGDLTWSTVPAPALDDLTDVTITTPSNGQLLRYQAGTWINFTPTYISLTALSATAPLSYNNTTGVFSISQATTSTNGYLSSTDWNTFNGKQNTITLTTTGTSGAATLVGSTLNIPNYGSALSGYLPLTGGTLTGALNGTSASFSSSVQVGSYLNIYSGAYAAQTIPSIRASSANNLILNAASTGTLYLNYETGSGGVYFGNGAFGLRMLLDASGNLGLGVTPSAWRTTDKVLQINNGSIYDENGINFWIGQNYYENSAGAYIYLANSGASAYRQYNGQHQWFNAASGTAGTTISFTQAMTLNASGNLSIGNTNNTYKLDVSGQSVIRASNTNGIALQAIATDGNATIYLRPNNSGYNLISSNYLSTSPYLPLVLSGRENSSDLVLWTGGNISIGQSSDAGYKLDVNGTGRFSGVLRLNAAESNTVYLGAFLWTPGTYTGFRQGTDQSFNIDTYNGGTYVNAFKIAQTGAATFSSSVTATNYIASNSEALRIQKDDGYISFWNTANSTRSGYLQGNTTSIQLSSSLATPILFLTSDTERMRITSAGNVGIGTSSPAKQLDVYSSATSNTAQIVVSDASSTNRLYLGTFSNGSYISFGGTYQSGWSPNGTNAIANIGMSATSGASTIQFETSSTNGAGPTERMRITSGGNVLIGTTTDAGYKLDVNGTGRFSADLRLDTGASDSQLIFKNNASGSPRSIVYNVADASITFNKTSGGAGATFANSGAATFSSSTALISAFDTSNANGGYLVLRQSAADKFYIGARGVVSGDGGTGYDLYSATGNDIRIFAGGTKALTLATTGAATFSSSVTATGFFESSDKRLKKELIDNPTSVNIENVKPKLYIKDGREELGYYAQDLQSILPSSVTEGKDGFLSLSYTQVHTAKIAALENKIEQLEALIKTLIK